MRVEAPWTEAQVRNLEAWQAAGFVHEFTCPCPCRGALIPAKLGWFCPSNNTLRQTWAHDYMLEGVALAEARRSLLSLGWIAQAPGEFTTMPDPDDGRSPHWGMLAILVYILAIVGIGVMLRWG